MKAAEIPRRPGEEHLWTQVDDDYGTCRETWAELRLVFASLTGSLTLEEAEAALGPPAVSLRRIRIGRGAAGFVFALSSQGEVPSRDLRRHLDWLLAALAGRGAALDALRRRGVALVVHCPWRGEMGGPTLWPAQMRGLAAFDLDVALDYSWADPTAPGPESPFGEAGED